MDDLAATVMDQLNELSVRISAFDGVFQSLDGLSAAAPSIGRRVKGSLGVLAAVFDEQCSLLLASTIGRRLRSIANRTEHHCEIYRSVLSTRESMARTPAWEMVLEKYPAILSPIDRFLYIYRCPACQLEPTEDGASNLRAALAQIGTQIEAHKRRGMYTRRVHESLLRLRDWLTVNLKPGLPWHEMAQRLADRYSMLDSWSRLCCSAVYATVWRLHEAGLYSDSVATAMFLLHQNTPHGRFLHSGFLRSFGQLRTSYLSGSFTWEKFALILQAIEAQVAIRTVDAPATATILRRAARRYKRLLKVFARSFDTDALYLLTEQLAQQEKEAAGKLPRLLPFDANDAEDDESDSPILELRHWLSGTGRPEHLRRATDGGGVGAGFGGMEQGDSPYPLADLGDGSSLLTLRVLRGIPPERLAQLVDSRGPQIELMLRLERHLRLVLDCLDELPRDGQPLSVQQMARRDQVASDANLLLGALARLLRLASELGSGGGYPR